MKMEGRKADRQQILPVSSVNQNLSKGFNEGRNVVGKIPINKNKAK